MIYQFPKLLDTIFIYVDSITAHGANFKINQLKINPESERRTLRKTKANRSYLPQSLPIPVPAFPIYLTITFP